MSPEFQNQEAARIAASFPVGSWIYVDSWACDYAITRDPWRVLLTDAESVCVQHACEEKSIRLAWADSCRRVTDEEAILLNLAYPRE